MHTMNFLPFRTIDDGVKHPGIVVKNLSQQLFTIQVVEAQAVGLRQQVCTAQR